MIVSANRVRQAYVKKRSKKAMAAATLLMIVIAGACSIAATHDEQDRQAMAAEFSPARQRRIVSTWTVADATIELSSPRGQIGAK